MAPSWEFAGACKETIVAVAYSGGGIELKFLGTEECPGNENQWMVLVFRDM